MDALLSMLGRLIFLIITWSSMCSAVGYDVSHQLPVSLVHGFSRPTWLENLAIRPNGSILVTDLYQPNLYQVNPFLPSNATPNLIYTFPRYLSLIGIVETSPDVFAVIAGNYSIFTPPKGPKPGSFAVWLVDLHTHPDSPIVSKIQDFPQASLLNGMVYLPPPAHSLLITDSILGQIFKLNMTTNESSVAVESPLFKNCTSVAIGINGLKVSPDHRRLFFTNDDCTYFGTVPINPHSGTATGPAEIVAGSSIVGNVSLDDFALHHHQPSQAGLDEYTAYLAIVQNQVESLTFSIAAHPLNKIQIQSHAVIAGNLNSTEVPQPTALAFGRTPVDSKILYITSTGGLVFPINGSITLGGELLRLDLMGSVS